MTCRLPLEDRGLGFPSTAELFLLLLLTCGGNTNAPDKILKPGIASKRVQSEIHPDPGYSSRSLKKGLLHGLDSFLVFPQFGIGIGHDEPADIVFLGLLQRFG